METNKEYLMRTGAENFIYDTDYCKYCIYNDNCTTGQAYKSKCLFGIKQWLEQEHTNG